jgi:L-fucose mutarotase
MDMVDRPGLVPEIQQEVFSLARSVEDREIDIERIERFAFYERAA